MFDPADWYWRADDGRIFSSRKGGVVRSDDRDFTAFVERVGYTPRWPTDALDRQSEEALQDVLRPYGLFVSTDQRRLAAMSQVDAAAEAARLKYITPGAGQALTYQEKAAELARYDEDTQPRIAEYPLLAAEIGITADSLKGVADAVRAALAAWRQAGAAIEHVRLKAKADVEKTRDDKAVQAVIDAIEWP